MSTSPAHADALEAVLREQVLDCWFPRSVDSQHGGFLCDFDRTWAHCGPHDKFLEFQARQTLMAADASRRYPSNQTLREAALHGFCYLRNVMWDRDAGGWFHRMDRNGLPLERATKHVHGMVYAVQACAVIFQVLGEPEALALARDGFAWIEQHAHDEDYGGYFGFLTREGMVIRNPCDCPWAAEADTLGTPIGLKDLNVHSDYLEALVELIGVWPDARVAARLLELIDIVSHRLLGPTTGLLHMFATAEWKQLPYPVRSGYQFQSGYRLMLASRVAGDRSALGRLMRQLADLTCARAWDQRKGGFFFEPLGDATANAYRDKDPRAPLKDWWVQFEALRTLLALSQLGEDEERYRTAFDRQWRYMQRYLTDATHKGFYNVGIDVVPRRQRLFNARFAPADITKKGDIWKDASHDGRTLLHCIDMLRRPLSDRGGPAA